MLSDTEIRIILQGETTETVKTNIGLPEGSGLSLTLFIYFLRKSTKRFLGLKMES